MPAAPTDKKSQPGGAKLEHAIARLADLPTTPSTLLKIWQLVDSPDSSASDLERVIVTDQALSAKIIRLVNSPYHGLRDPVTSCKQAVTLLGFKTVKNLSVCVSVVSACIPGRDRTGELDLLALWRHSIATGVCASEIASRAGRVDPETAFTAGVLHDIGKFALSLVMKSEYGDAVRCAHERGVDIRSAEQEVLGVDHCLAGDELAKRWGFPDELREVLAGHHEAMPQSGDLELVEVVARANDVAREIREGSSGDPVQTTVAADTWKRIAVDVGEREEFLLALEARIAKARDMMNLAV